MLVSLNRFFVFLVRCDCRVKLLRVQRRLFYDDSRELTQAEYGTLEHYIGVTEEKAAPDIERFLQTLSDNNILDDGRIRGCTFARMPKELLDRLWPAGGLSGKEKSRREKSLAPGN